MKGKRLFAIIMALALVFTYMPALAFADVENSENTEVPSASVESETGDTQNTIDGEEVTNGQNEDGEIATEQTIPDEESDKDSAAGSPEDVSVDGNIVDEPEEGNGADSDSDLEEPADTMPEGATRGIKNISSEEGTVEDVEIILAEPVVYEEYTHGCPGSDEQGNEIWYYNYEYREGDQFHITYKDGADEYVYYNSLTEHGNFDAYFNSSPYVPGEENYHTGHFYERDGEGNILTDIELRIPFDVEEDEKRIESIAYQPADNGRIEQYTNGYYSGDPDDPDSLQYYYYLNAREGDVLTIIYEDGSSTEFTYGPAENDYWEFVGDDGDSIDPYYVYLSSPESQDEEWGPGKHAGTATYKKWTTSFELEIVADENKVTEIQYTPANNGAIKQYTGGWYSDDKYIYNVNQDDDVLTVSYEDGSDIDFTLGYGASHGYGFYSEQGDCISNDDISRFYDQMTEWEPGKHTVTVHYKGCSTTYEIEIVEDTNKAVTIEYTPANDGKITQYTNGWYNGDTFNYYVYQPGDVLTITYEDESSDVYTYSQYVNSFSNEQGESIHYGDIQFKADQSYNTDWDLGKYTVTVLYKGCSTSYDIEIVESNIKSIAYESAKPFWAEASDSPDADVLRNQFYGSTHYGDILTVDYGDESVTYTFNGYEFIPDDESYASFTINDAILTTDDEEWAAGTQGTFKLTVMGKSTEVPVTILSPVEDFTYAPATGSFYYYKEFKVVDLDENENEITKYQLFPDYPKEGDVLTLICEDGSSEEYTLRRRPDGEGSYWESDAGINRVNWVSFTDNQGDGTAWDDEAVIPTATVNVNLASDGDGSSLSKDYEVELRENPVESISYVQEETPILYEGFDNEEGAYYFEGCLGDKLIITLKDHSKKVYTYSEYVDEEGDEYGAYLSGDELLESSEYDISSNQSDDNVWGIGEHYFTFSYLGFETTIPVIVEASPIKSISFEPSEFKYNADTVRKTDSWTQDQPFQYFDLRMRGAGYEDSEDSYYTFFADGDKLTVNYKDNTSAVFTFTYDTEAEEWDFLDNEGGSIPHYVDFDYPSSEDQLENPLKLGLNEDVITITYGNCTFDIDVSLEGEEPQCAHENLEYVDGQDPTCEEGGLEDYYRCPECGKLFSDADGENEITEPIPVGPLGHDWQAPIYTWSDDYTTATATRTCLRNPLEPHVETETVITEQKTTAECGQPGTVTYTAVFENEAFETQTHTETLDIVDHDWGKAEYTWSDDNSQVTAKRVCKRESSHVDEETVDTTAVEKTPAACGVNSVTTYTAEFGNEAFETQTKDVENNDALTHDWNEPTYVWSDDNSSVTAELVCKHDSNRDHVITESVDTVFEEVTPPTYSAQGKGKYTATFTKDGFTEQTKVVDIPVKDSTEELARIDGLADEAKDAAAEAVGKANDAKTAVAALETAVTAAKEAADTALESLSEEDITAAQEKAAAAEAAQTAAQTAIEAAETAKAAADSAISAVNAAITEAETEGLTVGDTITDKVNSAETDAGSADTAINQASSDKTAQAGKLADAKQSITEAQNKKTLKDTANTKAAAALTAAGTAKTKADEAAGAVADYQTAVENAQRAADAAAENPSQENTAAAANAMAAANKAKSDAETAINEAKAAATAASNAKDEAAEAISSAETAGVSVTEAANMLTSAGNTLDNANSTVGTAETAKAGQDTDLKNVEPKAEAAVKAAEAESAANNAKDKADEAAEAVQALEEAAQVAKEAAEKAAASLSDQDIANAKEKAADAAEKKALAEAAIAAAEEAKTVADSAIADAQNALDNAGITSGAVKDKVDAAESIADEAGNINGDTRDAQAAANSVADKAAQTTNKAAADKAAADKAAADKAAADKAAAAKKDAAAKAEAARKAAEFAANGNAYVDPTLPKVKIQKPKAAKKSFTAKWKKIKNKKQLKKIKGIEVEYSLTADFQNPLFKSASKKKANVKIKKLLSKKTYYVRAHTYVIRDGVKYVSYWSAAKKVKVK